MFISDLEANFICKTQPRLTVKSCPATMSQKIPWATSLLTCFDGENCGDSYYYLFTTSSYLHPFAFVWLSSGASSFDRLLFCYTVYASLSLLSSLRLTARKMTASRLEHATAGFYTAGVHLYTRAITLRSHTDVPKGHITRLLSDARSEHKRSAHETFS